MVAESVEGAATCRISASRFYWAATSAAISIYCHCHYHCHYHDHYHEHDHYHDDDDDYYDSYTPRFRETAREASHSCRSARFLVSVPNPGAEPLALSGKMQQEH